MKTVWTVYDLSPHLFWDTNPNLLDFESAKEYIIGKVIEYGRMEDWRIIRQVYDVQTIKDVVIDIRSMDDVTLSFLANFLNLDKSAFRCYKPVPSAQDFWNS